MAFHTQPDLALCSHCKRTLYVKINMCICVCVCVCACACVCVCGAKAGLARGWLRAECRSAELTGAFLHHDGGTRYSLMYATPRLANTNTSRYTHAHTHTHTHT